MILNALRQFRSLSGYHYRMVVLTILLPAIGPTSLASFGPDHFILRVILYVAAFFVWSVSVVLAVASMLNRDKSEAEQLMSQKLETLSTQIGKLKEEHEDSKVDLWQQVNGLEELVRSTLSEELGVVLPRRPISLRMRATAGSPKASFSLTVVGESRLARLRLQLLRAMSRLWEVVYGRQEVS